MLLYRDRAALAVDPMYEQTLGWQSEQPFGRAGSWR
jgi:hypothetical protein